jgi:hypothetical protein
VKESAPVYVQCVYAVMLCCVWRLSIASAAYTYKRRVFAMYEYLQSVVLLLAVLQFLSACLELSLVKSIGLSNKLI